MNKVQQMNDLHSKAMEMANLAFIARVQGEPDKVRQFSKTAFDYERQAALLLLMDYEIEPTRSVLFRSAATLALNGENYREADRPWQFWKSYANYFTNCYYCHGLNHSTYRNFLMNQ